MRFQTSFSSVLIVAIWIAAVNAAPVLDCALNVSVTCLPSLVLRAPSGPTLYGDPDDPQNDKRLEQLRGGFNDAIRMAKIVMLQSFRGGRDDVTFQNYFHEEHFNFVREVFGRIANIEASANSEREIRNQMDNRPLNPKFNKLSIHVGDDKRLPEELKEGKKRPLYAYLWQFDDVPGDDRQAASLSVCDNGFKFPRIHEITNPNRAGPGVGAGLGTSDNGWMTSLGAHILHELVHWRYLFDDIPGWNQHIRKSAIDDPDNMRYIIDYSYATQLEPGKYREPDNGYGPGHAHDVALHDIASNGPQAGYHDGLNNADNYKWYAVSKWWARACGRDFDAVDVDDNGLYGDTLRLDWNDDRPGEPATGFAAGTP